MHRKGDLASGHLHLDLFWHATAGGHRRRIRAGRAAWATTSTGYLLALSLEACGLPVRMFTLHRWVTGWHGLDTGTTMSLVERSAAGAEGPHAASCRWITAFVHQYRPRIRLLPVQRGRRLARRADLARALADHRLEVQGLRRLNWAADLDAIEVQAARRGR